VLVQDPDTKVHVLFFHKTYRIKRQLRLEPTHWLPSLAILCTA